MLFNNNEHVLWLELLIIPKLWVVECYKAAFVTKTGEKLEFEMYDNAKLCIVMKMVRVFVKNERSLTVLILENK